MEFNSVAYLLFLPTVFLLYWFVFKSKNSRNKLIVAASYLFYGCWDYRFLLLLFFVSLVSFRIGAALSLYRENRLRLKTLLAGGILINAGVLFVF